MWGNVVRQLTEGDKLAILAQAPLLAEFSRFELAALLDYLHERRYHAFETIFHEKEPGTGFYIVLSGRVRIQGVTLSGSVELQPGAVFGEISLIEPLPRLAQATALEDTVVWGFFQADLSGLEERDPALARKLLRGMVRILSLRLQAKHRVFGHE